MLESLPVPIWVILVGITMSVALVVYLYMTRSFGIIETTIERFDDSPIDLYITDLAKSLPQAHKEILRDFAEVISPLTERTPNDLDDKTLKLLEDWIIVKKS